VLALGEAVLRIEQSVDPLHEPIGQGPEGRVVLLGRACERRERLVDAELGELAVARERPADPIGDRAAAADRRIARIGAVRPIAADWNDRRAGVESTR
jgi:hypothetical protein